MTRGKAIEPKILEYLRKKKAGVTFKELYNALDQFSPQGIRNGMNRLAKKGAVEKIQIDATEGKARVRFKISTK